MRVLLAADEASLGIPWVRPLLEASVQELARHLTSRRQDAIFGSILDEHSLRKRFSRLFDTFGMRPTPTTLHKAVVGEAVDRVAPNAHWPGVISEATPHAVLIERADRAWGHQPQWVARADSKQWVARGSRQLLTVPSTFVRTLLSEIPGTLAEHDGQSYWGDGVRVATDGPPGPPVFPEMAAQITISVLDAEHATQATDLVEELRRIVPLRLRDLPDLRVLNYLSAKHGTTINSWRESLVAAAILDRLWTPSLCAQFDRSGGAPSTRQPSQAAADRTTFDQIVALAGSTMCQACHFEPASILDHDHLTGLIRGVLCVRCNNGVDRCLHLPRAGCPWGNYLDSPPAAPLRLQYRRMAKDRKQRATVAMIVRSNPDLNYLEPHISRFATFDAADEPTPQAIGQTWGGFAPVRCAHS